jgi:hypothetical protein
MIMSLLKFIFTIVVVYYLTVFTLTLFFIAMATA